MIAPSMPARSTQHVLVNATNARAGGGKVFADEVLPKLRLHLERMSVKLYTFTSGEEGVLRSISHAHWLACTRLSQPGLILNVGNVVMAAPPSVPQWLMVRNRLLVDRDERRRNLRNRLRSIALSRSLRYSERWIVPSEAMKGALYGFAVARGIMPRQTWTLPHGIAAPRATRRAMNGNVIRIIYPAIPATHKNFGVLLDSIAELRLGGIDARLTLTVTADALSKLLGATSELPDWVSCLGPISNTLVQELYLSHDVLAFPSTCEAFGIPLIEARCRGLAVVASDLDVFRELADEYVEFCSVDDHHMWAAALRRVVRRGSVPASTVTRTWDDVARELACAIIRRLEVQ